jgi:hypothetical protein
VKRHLTEANRERLSKEKDPTLIYSPQNEKLVLTKLELNFKFASLPLFLYPPLSLSPFAFGRKKTASTLTKRSVIGLGGGRSLLILALLIPGI